MPKTIKMYTVDELCGESKEIIIKSNRGTEIKIECVGDETRIVFYFGNEVIEREFDYLVKPVETP